MERKYRGILWDVDGTLIDSEPLHDEAVLVSMEEMGVMNASSANALDMLGTTWEQTWINVKGKPEQLSEFMQKAEAYYLRNIERLKPRADAVDWVRKFNGAGIVQAAVSNSHETIVRANLKHLGICEMMGAIITLNDCKRGKPHPEPYQNAAKALSLDIRSCVAIEDSPRGAQSAKAAGALTLFWPQNETLETKECDVKIVRLSDFSWADHLTL